MQDWVKTEKNICSFALLAVCLFLQTALPVYAGANEVVKDSGTEECVEIQLPVEKQQQVVSEDEVISVSMPLQTPFTMNPTKSFGEEQIWSPEFHFQNNSRTAVEVTVRNIRYILKENSTIVTHYQPFDNLEERKKKEIYLCLRFGDMEVPVGDLSREYCFTLAGAGEGSSAGRTFSIEGMMSCYPEQEWQDGDVSIAFQVEYKAVSRRQITADGENAADTATPKDEDEKKQTPSGEQTSSEKTGISLTEVKGTEWQKDLIGAVLLEKEPAGTEKREEKAQIGTGEMAQMSAEEKANIRAYIIDSGQKERKAGDSAQKEAQNMVQKANAVSNDAAAGDQTGTEEFSFDWKKILDDYEKYADAIPEGATLLLDANETAEVPVSYVTEEGLEGLNLAVQSEGAVYACWRNPDYVPEENKVWHIEDDVPYYISNPEQPWLWSAADEDVPSDAEPVFLWIKKDDNAQSRADASQQNYQDIQKKEGNAEYEPRNNTGDTAAE